MIITIPFAALKAQNVMKIVGFGYPLSGRASILQSTGR